MRIAGPLLLIIASLALAISCSADPRVAERGIGPQARCIDICGANFTACTQNNPGDYTACADDRRQCDKECESQAAEQRIEPANEAVEPVDVPLGNQPESETPPPSTEGEVPLPEAEPEAAPEGDPAPEA